MNVMYVQQVLILITIIKNAKIVVLDFFLKKVHLLVQNAPMDIFQQKVQVNVKYVQLVLILIMIIKNVKIVLKIINHIVVLTNAIKKIHIPNNVLLGNIIVQTNAKNAQKATIVKVVYLGIQNAQKVHIQKKVHLYAKDVQQEKNLQVVRINV